MTTLVVAELDGEQVLDVCLEAVTLARESLPGPVEVVAFADWPAGAVEELGRYGVARLQRVAGDAFTSYAPAAWGAALVELATRRGAAAIVAAGTPRGSELMAHAAARLDVTMAANVVDVTAAEPLTVKRQVLGGTALEVVELDATAVLTVAGHALEAKPAGASDPPERCEQRVGVSEADLRARVSRVEAREQSDTGALTSARVVVGAGRGAGSADGFADLLELTELLGGALGVSRVVTSLGWRPHQEQVGQTGSRITPELYIPCGISGAIQHWAGCQGARTILAINTDAEAPMVTRAHYAVVGDLHEVVPAVNEELRRRRAAGGGGQ